MRRRLGVSLASVCGDGKTDPPEEEGDDGKYYISFEFVHPQFSRRHSIFCLRQTSLRHLVAFAMLDLAQNGFAGIETIVVSCDLIRCVQR